MKNIVLDLFNDLHLKKKFVNFVFHCSLVTNMVSLDLQGLYSWQFTKRLFCFIIHAYFYCILMYCSATLLLELDISAYFISVNIYVLSIFVFACKLLVIFPTVQKNSIAMPFDCLYWMCNDYYSDWYVIFVQLIYDHFGKRS